MTQGILPRAPQGAPHRAARRAFRRDSLRVSILGAALASAVASLALSGTASAQAGAQSEAQRDPRNRGGGTCTANAYNCVDAVNPLPAPNTVWIEEMREMARGRRERERYPRYVCIVEPHPQPICVRRRLAETSGHRCLDGCRHPREMCP